MASNVVAQIREMRQIILAKQVLMEAEHMLARETLAGIGLAVSLAQDSVELLLRAVAREWSLQLKRPKDATFHDLLSAVDDACRSRPIGALPQRQKLVTLNDIRVGFKHHGQVPSRESARELVACASDFFDGCCRQMLGIDPDSVSVTDLIADAAIRRRLKAAETAFASGDAREAMTEAARAFHDVMRAFDHVLPPLSSRLGHLSVEDDGTAHAIKLVIAYSDTLRDLALCAHLRINPQGLAVFRAITPSVAPSVEGDPEREQVILRPLGASGPTAGQAQFCIRFVRDTALIVQEKVVPLGQWHPT